MTSSHSIAVSVAGSLILTIALVHEGPSEGARLPASHQPDSCPVTRVPDRPFHPPAPYPHLAPSEAHFWHGVDGLWTMLRQDGTWRGIPPDRGYRRGYRDKLFWWRPGYDGYREPVAPLAVSARRLDGDAPVVVIPSATNAHHEDFGGWAMLVALDIPGTGCWEITGRYGDEAVTFVTWVVP